VRLRALPAAAGPLAALVAAACGPSGEKVLRKKSVTLYVAVATFADGTRHAVGVHCGVGDCIPVP
jgi:hypothetical protein